MKITEETLKSDARIERLLKNPNWKPAADAAMAYLLKPRGKRSKAARVDAPLVETRQIYILVVDDSPSVRHMNTRLIQGAGWNAVVAA